MRRQYIMAAAGMVALVALFFLLLIRPTSNRISDTRREVDTARSEGRSLRVQLQTLRVAQQEDPAIQARLARFNTLLPSEADMPALIRQLQAASDNAGIDLNSIAPSPPAALTGQPGVQTMQVVLQIRGGYFRLESFLARLELLARVVEVQNLSISPSKDPQTGLDTLQSTVTLRTYIVGGAAAAPAPRPTPSPTRTP